MKDSDPSETGNECEFYSYSSLQELGLWQSLEDPPELKKQNWEGVET